MSDWRHRARCRDVTVDLFYPIGNAGSDYIDDQIAKATAYCDRCPVRETCLAWALDAGESYGIWGGVRLDGLKAKTKATIRLQLQARRTA